MPGLLKRESRAVEPVDVFDWFDRMMGDWSLMPWRRRGLLGRPWLAEDVIRVDEFRENGNLVIRAELPGIDPDRDVQLTVSDGMLHIEAERREEEKTEERGYVRHELSYGTFSRSLPLPAGVSESDIHASYKDGILEIRIPAPALESAKKIPIAKA